MNWHLGRLCTWDTETTGPNPEQARLVTACVALVGGGQPPQPATWLSDVDGENIPDEAAAIHGITTAQARTEGRPAAEVIEQITAALAQAATAGIPLLAMNARYDFTVLDREARRYGVTPLTDIVGDQLRVIDPYVIDKHVDRYRKGKRTLTALSAHYDVVLDGAHSADGDALAAARVAWRQCQRYPRLASMSLDELHAAQIGWAAEQAASLQAHFRETNPAAVVEHAWPLVPCRTAEEATA